MSEIPKESLLLKLYSFPVSRTWYSFLFGVTFLINSASLIAQDYYNTTPDFQFVSAVDLPTVTVEALNYQDLTIAIATGPDGNVYTLTFGKGVDKRDAQGNLLQAGIISASHLDSPRDMAIDEEGYFYIADYLAAGETYTDNGKIRVFDPQGNYLPERTIYSSFYRPLGLDVKGDKVYAAEYYDGLQGPEKGSTFSRIRIYDKQTRAVLKQNKNVELPIRIAVNSSGMIYVSQAGTASASVLLLDEDLNKLGQLPNIVSPGSVVIDSYDFVHVLEYGNRLEFSDFINFEALSIGDLLAIAEQMILGIENEEFYVKVFNTAGEQVTTLVNHIDFPVDLTIASCENIYVDNAEVFEGLIPFLGLAPSKIEFDLEVYKRLPTFDAANAPEITCNGNIEITAVSGENYAIVEFPGATATDECTVTVTQTKGLPSGSQFPVGVNTIEFIATDGAGNTSVCGFSIFVTASNDLVPQFSNCPSTMENVAAEGQCGLMISFATPTAFDESGGLEVTQVEGLPSESFFEIGEHSIVFEAIDEQGNRSTCGFLIIVKDEQAPTISCSSNLEFSVDFGIPGRVVIFETPLVSDNCTGNAFEQVEGLPSGSEFPVGLTVNTFKAIDGSGNTSTCSFNILITENSDTEPPVISCPADLFINVENGSCGQIVNYEIPEISDNSGAVTLELIQGLMPGEFFELGATSLTFKATDSAGNSTECSFTINLEDKSPPTLTVCPSDIIEVISTSEFILEDYTSRVEFSDCSTELSVTQDPAPGTSIIESSLIKVFAEDSAGNRSQTCEFNVILQKEALIITSCPTDKNLEVGTDCTFMVNNYTSEVTTNHSAVVTQTPAPGTLISEDTQVNFTAEDEFGNIAECYFKILLSDVSAPQISCPGEKQYSFVSGVGFTVPDFTTDISVTDNCSFEIRQEPAPGSVIFDSKEVVISVIDGGGNRNECSFFLNLTEVAMPLVEITSCPSTIYLTLNTDCTAEIPDIRTQVTTNIDAQITQNPPTGTLITSGTVIQVTAIDALGNSVTCMVTIELEDNTPPEISCGNDIFKTIAFGENFVLPDFRNTISVSDCSENITITQEPVPGTVISTSTTITFIAIDAAGNRSQDCKFDLILQQEALEISHCPVSKFVEIKDDCSVILEDFRESVQLNHSAEIIQVPAPGTIIYDSVKLEFFAEDENGSKASCSLQLTLEDTTAPEIDCSGSKEFTFDAATGFTMPDFRSTAMVTENCEYETFQEPAPGIVIFESREVLITVIDDSGNSSFCTFDLTLTAEVAPVVEITSCPVEMVVPLNENCAAQIPDLTGAVHTNISATIEQFPVAGTVIYENLSIEIRATDSKGNSDVCTVPLKIEDQTPPEITCTGNLQFAWEPENGFILPDFSGNVEVFENCTSYTLTQNPAPNTLITSETSEITIMARDDSGNVTSCSFLLLLSEVEQLSIFCPGDQKAQLNANCGYIVPDFRGTAQVSLPNAVVTQDPPAGQFITSDTQVTLTATKDNLTDSCDFQLFLVDETPPEISCIETLVIDLKSGESTSISPVDIDAGSTDNCEIVSKVVSRSIFTSADEGEHTITFSVTDASGNSASCETLVEVRVEEDPAESIQCVEAVLLQINETGTVYLDPRTLFSGGTGTAQYSLSKEQFTCADIGEQVVVLNYVTPGASGACNIKVIVEDPDGYCEIINTDPADSLPYVIITPNPGKGEVKIVTSAEIVLKKAEVFDQRGRFLTEKSFSETSKNYVLDLGMFESGVYTIRLIGEEQEYIKRAIIHNN